MAIRKQILQCICSLKSSTRYINKSFIDLLFYETDIKEVDITISMSKDINYEWLLMNVGLGAEAHARWKKVKKREKKNTSGLQVTPTWRATMWKETCKYRCPKT